MKKILLLSLILSSFACKKESSTLPDKISASAEKIPLLFNVSQFKLETKPMGTTVSGLKDQIKYLHYSVFDITNRDNGGFPAYIRKIDQLADSTANFGTIKDSLPPGKYQIVFAGGNTSKFEDVYISGSRSSPDRPGIQQEIPFCDSFGYLYEVTVGNQQIKENIVLKRMVAKISVVISDVIPAYAKKIVLVKHTTPSVVDMADGLYGLFRDFTDIPDQFAEHKFTADEYGRKNVQFSTYVYGGAQSFTVNCYDANNKLIVSKDLSTENYRVEINKQYKFTGKLFESNSEFSVAVDDEWDSTTTIPFGTIVNKPDLK